MSYLFLFVAPILSAIKVVSQGRYAKKNVNNLSDVLLFNAVVFFATALILALLFVRAIPPIEVFLFASLTSVFTVAFQVCYTLAFKSGPIAPTVIICNFNIVITLLVGLIFFGEKWSIFTFVGLAFMAVAFFLIPAKSGENKVNLKWVLFTCLAFLSTGLINVVSLLFARSEYRAWKSTYLSIAFLFACVLALLILLVNVKVKKQPLQMKINLNLPLTALIIAGALGLFNLFNIYALQYFESYIALPVISGLGIVTATVLNFFVNKEKISKRMMIGVLFAIISIVLLNL